MKKKKTKMLLKCVSINLLLLLCVVTLTPAAVAPSYRHFCPQCEEEVWEEVPCDEISKCTTTTTTTASPILLTVPTTPQPYTTSRPYILKQPAPTQAPLAYIHNVTANAANTPSTTPSTYNRCYCECKVGCKEFCRKVTVDGATDKQITQISKTSHRLPHGNIETDHVHLHRFVPDAAPAPYNPSIHAASAVVTNAPLIHKVYPIETNNEHAEPYVQSNLAYEVQPALQQPPNPQLAPQLAQSLPPHAVLPQSQAHAIPVSYSQHARAIYENPKDTYTYPDVLMDASYSVDELTRLLQMESLNKDTPITYGQPTLYTPAYNAAHNSIPTASNTNGLSSASSTLHNPISQPSSPASNQASLESTVAQKHKHNLSLPHYESTNPGCSSVPQYANYIDKHYENSDHQSSPSSDQQAAYDNESRHYRSSDSDNTYQDRLASHSSSHTISY
ncbi:uncharacterized protein [Eurosta solidaginis]|uniref:uncharacterized protein n=1 Tax=Eurosta solidaginis TaxID=178769 RepID=UPI003530C3F8